MCNTYFVCDEVYVILVLAMHIMHTIMAWQRVHKMHGQSVRAPFTARTSEACHRPMTRLAGRGRRFFFLQTRIAIPQYFSQSYGAYFKHIARTCTCAYTYCKCLRDVILRHIKIRAI